MIFIYCSRSLCVEPFNHSSKSTIYFYYLSILDDFTNVCFKILTLLFTRILYTVLRGEGRVLFVRSCVSVLVHYTYNLKIPCSKLSGLSMYVPLTHLI